MLVLFLLLERGLVLCIDRQQDRVVVSIRHGPLDHVGPDVASIVSLEDIRNVASTNKACEWSEWGRHVGLCFL